MSFFYLGSTDLLTLLCLLNIKSYGQLLDQTITCLILSYKRQYFFNMFLFAMKICLCLYYTNINQTHPVVSAIKVFFMSRKNVNGLMLMVLQIYIYIAPKT